jgi:hypothetical protein
VPLTVRSAAAEESLLSSSYAIDPALRAHHNRTPFENSYVAGHCNFEAQAVSNTLTHGFGGKQGLKLMRCLYAAFYIGSITVQLSFGLCEIGLMELNGKNFVGTLPLLQKP